MVGRRRGEVADRIGSENRVTGIVSRHNVSQWPDCGERQEIEHQNRLLVPLRKLSQR
jgi:hypothetical protein